MREAQEITTEIEALTQFRVEAEESPHAGRYQQLIDVEIRVLKEAMSIDSIFNFFQQDEELFQSAMGAQDWMTSTTGKDVAPSQVWESTFG
jgi:hypothetical protein